MSDQTTQASGVAPSDTTAQPGGSQAAPSTASPELAELKSKYEKANGDLQRMKDFFTAYPDLVQFARKYTEDQNAASMVRNYLAGKPVSVGSQDASDSDDDALSTLDANQRKAVEKLLEQKLDGVMAPIKSQNQQLQQHVLNQQIKEWRATYNKANGWPVDFKEVEGSVAELIQNGKANDAEVAYKLLAADHYRKNGADQEKQIRELKQKASMSRASLPTQLAVRGKGERKSIEEAWVEALEQAGGLED